VLVVSHADADVVPDAQAAGGEIDERLRLIEQE
jgi:hypothetical protein